jgi:hypothetical protein
MLINYLLDIFYIIKNYKKFALYITMGRHCIKCTFNLIITHTHTHTHTHTRIYIYT